MDNYTKETGGSPGDDASFAAWQQQDEHHVVQYTYQPYKDSTLGHHHLPNLAASCLSCAPAIRELVAQIAARVACHHHCQVVIANLLVQSLRIPTIGISNTKKFGVPIYRNPPINYSSRCGYLMGGTESQVCNNKMNTLI